MREMIMLWFNKKSGRYHMGTETDFHNALREFSHEALTTMYKMNGSQWEVLKKIEQKLNKAAELDTHKPLV